MTTTALTPALARFERHVSEARGRRDLLLQQRQAVQEALESARAEQELLLGVRVLLHHVSGAAREAGRQHIEALVTQALQAVFGPALSYQVTVVERAGRAEADLHLVVEEGGVQVVDDSREAHGGGYTDVETFALRVALLEGAYPRLGGPLILDEPGKMVSEEFRPALAQLIRALSQRFSRQVVMVTHSPAIGQAADRTFQVVMRDGASQVAVVAGRAKTTDLTTGETVSEQVMFDV